MAAFEVFIQCLPEAEGGVGEVRRAVKVSDSQAAADVGHGGQGGVLPLHDPPLDGALVGAVAEGHQSVVVVQTEDGDGLEFCRVIAFLFGKRSPVADHAPSGESGLVADEISIVRVSASEHGVGANVTLTLPRGEVPVGNCKILIAGQSLRRRNPAIFFSISTILSWVAIAFLLNRLPKNTMNVPAALAPD